MKPINVLSLFDGISCGQIALARAGIPVANYYASEIDKHAIKVTQHNWPETKQLGSVTEIKHIDWAETKIDLLIGGSPCQGFSFAGKQLNFDDPRSALFFEYVRILKEIQAVNPDVKFLLENVVMKQQFQDVISFHLGVKPVLVNSALVSAQTRKRLYWTNIDGFITPLDKYILLKDILQDNVDNKYFHSQEAIDYMCREVSGGRSHWDFKHHSDTAEAKSRCVTANIFKGIPYNVLIVREATKTGYITLNPGECFDNTFSESKTRRGRKMADKANCLTAAKYEFNQYLGGTVVRKFTPTECERLQTTPDGYTDVGISDSQRYRALGNGWTVDVIVELFKPLAQQLQKNNVA